ncbi:unnamed protein product [Lactuca saligna]|uniref:Uncharacterized protein n=1 Tax=Lactuca saligna TaxID=75948 RepID=A0AA35ZSI7_LACSI|nr:unnamed protein product [Lactuca saligna]
MIECLKFSPLAQALTMAEFVPLVHHSKAYSSTIYNKAEDIIHFEETLSSLILKWVVHSLVHDGVSKRLLLGGDSLKQRGDKDQQPLTETDQKGIEAFASKKGEWKEIDEEENEFTLADQPFMNTYDWIFLFQIVMKDEKKYKPIVAHLKKMLIYYIHEIAKMDVKIALVLMKRSILKTEEQLKDIQKLKVGTI